VPTTIIGVLPNLPISWFGRDSEIFANKTVRAVRHYERSLDARSQLHARDGAVETWRFSLTGAGGDAGIIPKLQRATPGNGRQHLVAVPGPSGEDVTGETCVRLS